MGGSVREHVVTQWAIAALRGARVMGRPERLAYLRHLDDLRHGHERGLWFDTEAADRIFRWYGLHTHTKGPLAKTPVTLELWQAFVVGSVFGWKRVTDGQPVKRYARAEDMAGRKSVRRFDEVYEEVARKNGKTTKLAPPMTYTAGMEGESRAENYCAATKKEQAEILFKDVAAMVKASPVLRRMFNVERKLIEQPDTEGTIIALSKDAHSMDGLNPYLVVVDELHAHKTREVVDVLTSAFGARENQLLWAITTAGKGNQQHSICWEHRKRAMMVLEGQAKIDTIFAFICTLDKDDDWRDETVWPKANPNLGVSVTLEKLRGDLKKALVSPSAQNEFRRKRCNQWIGTEEAWITPETLKACRHDFDPLAYAKGEGAGRRPFWGVDLSSIKDITALAIIWPPAPGETAWRLTTRYYVPEKRILERVENDRLPYDIWRDEGHLHVTPGDMIDQDEVLNGCKELNALFGCERFGYDSWGGGDSFAVKMMNEGIGEGLKVRQGIPSMGYPSKVLEALVEGGHFIWDGNPVTEWMFTSAVLRRDANNNFMPDKGAAENSKSKIDGLVATIMAMAVTGLEEPKDDGSKISVSSSFYARA
jgi:phage terminase large subunit-like protein